MRRPKILYGLGRGTVALLLALLALLVAAIVFAVSVWISEEAALPPYIWAALAGGVFFSLVVGIGLMALVFYSSRAGYDEAPSLEAPSLEAPRLEEPDDNLHQDLNQDLGEHQAAPRTGR